MNLTKKIARAAVMAVVACSTIGINADYNSTIIKPNVVEATSADEVVYPLAGYIAMNNPRLSYDEAKNISNAIVYYSYQYGVDPVLMTALFQTESNFNSDSISNAGAIGIGQIMPGTAVALGVNPYDTYQNIQGSCSYIANALKTFSDWPYPTEAALAAYNAGTGAVIQYGGIPPYSETQNYVAKIRDRYSRIKTFITGEVIETTDRQVNMGAASYANEGYVEYVEQDEHPVGVVMDAEDY